jgi:uncharacterized membrane protein
MDSNPIFIVMNILLGLLAISISYLFSKFYPKEINPFAGYRTKRSMASQEAWEFANEYSSKLLFKCSIILVITQLPLTLFLTGKIALFLAAGIWITILIYTIVKTESKLRNKM